MTINEQHINNTGEKMNKILEALEDSIARWEIKVHKKTKDKTFLAMPFLAERLGCSIGSLYKKLKGEYNGVKLSLREFIMITEITKDERLVEVFAEVIKKNIEVSKV